MNILIAKDLMQKMVSISRHAAISASRVCTQVTALCVAATRSFAVSVASATSTDEGPLEDVQIPSPFLRASRYRILLLLAKHCDVIVAESITLKRSRDVICKRGTRFHTPVDIHVHI